jgi:hypothetical protein
MQRIRKAINEELAEHEHQFAFASDTSAVRIIVRMEQDKVRNVLFSRETDSELR